MSVVGCNQPKAKPGGWKFGDRHLLGRLKKSDLKEEPVIKDKATAPEPIRTDRLKTEKALSGLLPKIGDKQLRLLTMLAHELVKKS